MSGWTYAQLVHAVILTCAYSKDRFLILLRSEFGKYGQIVIQGLTSRAILPSLFSSLCRRSHADC
jgi:hypothetical protein